MSDHEKPFRTCLVIHSETLAAGIYFGLKLLKLLSFLKHWQPFMFSHKIFPVLVAAFCFVFAEFVPFFQYVTN